MSSILFLVIVTTSLMSCQFSRSFRVFSSFFFLFFRAISSLFSRGSLCCAHVNHAKLKKDGTPGVRCSISNGLGSQQGVPPARAVVLGVRQATPLASAAAAALWRPPIAASCCVNPATMTSCRSSLSAVQNASDRAFAPATTVQLCLVLHGHGSLPRLEVCLRGEAVCRQLVLLRLPCRERGCWLLVVVPFAVA